MAKLGEDHSKQLGWLKKFLLFQVTPFADFRYITDVLVLEPRR